MHRTQIMHEDGERTAHVYAKLNLGLLVCGRRSDGYHEVATILHEITLKDQFVWIPTGKPFTYSGAEGLAPEVDIARKILNVAPDRDTWVGTLRLHKRIPLSAGLGGGSSDAALALRIAFPGRSVEELVELAAHYGSDVPFFVRGGTALATGSGTTLQQISAGRYWFVIVVPPLEIANKTETMYRRLTPADFRDARVIHEVAERLQHGAALPVDLPNAFQHHAVAEPAVAAALSALRERAGNASLTGAGPSVFSVVDNERTAKSVANVLPAGLGQVFVATTAVERDDREVSRLAAAIRGTIQPVDATRP